MESPIDWYFHDPEATKYIEYDEPPVTLYFST